MLYETFGRSELHPRLQARGSEISLTAYARPRSGVLADDGERWAVVILPGGGYRMVAPSEGEPVALGFLAQGVQAFVLRYSIMPEAPWPQAFLETAAAVAFVRKNAERYGIRRDRLAICGFSAGGHLAGCLANLWRDELLADELGLTPEEVRPNAAILAYPVVSAEDPVAAPCITQLTGEGQPLPPELEKLSLEKSVSAQNPPTFLWCTDTDGTVPADNTLLYARALRAQGVSTELHLYSRGPHAMGTATAESARLRERVDARAATWLPLAASWLKTLDAQTEGSAQE